MKEIAITGTLEMPETEERTRMQSAMTDDLGLTLREVKARKKDGRTEYQYDMEGKYAGIIIAGPDRLIFNLQFHLTPKSSPK